MGETTDHREGDREVGLLDYWRAVWKRRWLIVALCVFSMLITYLYAMRLPKIFESTVTALLPQAEVGFGGSRISLPGLGGRGGTGGAEGTGGGVGSSLLPSMGISLAASTPNRDAYLAYLKSRTMREEVVAHFKLRWSPSVESLIGRISSEVSVDSSILKVTAESQDPRLSAELANYYLKHLEEMLARKAKRIQSLSKQFYLSRLEPARQDLEEAQKTLIGFQEKHRTLSLGVGTQVAIAAGAGSAATVVGMEMQRTLARMYLTDRHPEMIALDRQIYEAKKLLSHSLYGEPQELPPESPKSPPRKEFFVAATKMTPLQFKAADVLRTLQIRQGVYQMIATSVETSKYTDDTPPPQIEVIDPAIPPGGPSKPNILNYVRAAGIGSLVIGIFLALFLEYLERVKGLERLQMTESSWPGQRVVPATELANGPFSADLFNGPVPERHPSEGPITRFTERRRSSAEPLAQGPEERRFL